jgi:Protein of unknown function (DUF4058)
MPIHEWRRVPATIYHHFHQRWTISICDALNAGLLPPGYSALVEQYSSGLYPDVLAVQRRHSKPSSPRAEMTTLEAPRTRMTVRPREGRFHERANQVVIRHHLGDVVCAIEVVSPGNKAGKIAIREFVTKAVDFLRRGINLLVVDPFPPGPQDPQTLHKLIWDEFDAGVPFELPPDEPLLLASYRAAVPLLEFTPEAFIEPFRVGAGLPDMPAWLDTDLYVNVLLEPTYQAAWDVCPSDFRYLVEHDALPDENVPLE